MSDSKLEVENLITEVLDGIAVRKLNGDNPDIKDYLAKYPEYKAELICAYEEQMSGEILFGAITNPVNNDPDTDIEAAWNRFKNRPSSQQRIAMPSEYFRPSLSWILKIRSQQMIRALALGNTITFIAAATIIIAFIPLYSFLLNALDSSLFASALIAVSLLFSILLGATFCTLRLLGRVSPEEYAKTTIRGWAKSEILEIISYEIWKLGNSFLEDRNTLFLQNVANQKLLKAKSRTELLQFLVEERKLILAAVEKLDKLSRKSHSSIQRLKIMKCFAADECGIPIRRFCDHIIQFSPDMYKNRMEKYIENWRILLHGIRGDYGEEIFEESIVKLLRKNNRDHEKIRSRTSFQLQVLKYSDLNNYILDFIPNASASSSLINYVRAISFVANQAMTERVEQEKYNVFAIVSEQLRYLFHKQKAYIGFDLHVAALRLCATETDNTKLRTTRTLLERIQDNSIPNIFDINKERATNELTLLSELYGSTNVVININRKRIVEKFSQEYSSWLSSIEKQEDKNDKVLVTHGYSKTVLEMLKTVVFKDAESINKRIPPKLFVMKSDDQESFEARLMMFELKEDYSLPDLKDAFPDNKNVLTNTKIMVVIGAEGFDNDRWVFHPPRDASRLRSLKNFAQENGSEVFVVVVGESYKNYPSLTQLPEFYQDKLENTYLSKPDLIDLIITDKAVIRKSDSQLESNFDDFLNSMGPFEQYT
ncbi:MAG: hypothetical protein ACRBF0_07000 [Calditrichia bacterium]